MRRTIRGIPYLVVTMLLLVGSTAAFASGFSIFEQGSKATAMGGAFAATADDPSAMFYNVSGIAYQRELKLMGGGTAITFSNEFRGDNSVYPGPGVTAAYEDHTFVPPNAYVVMPVGDNLTFGVGTFTQFGLRTDWENGSSFPGRFISMDANVKTLSIQPSVAWKTSDGKFAIGAGAEYRTSHITLQRNVNGINPFNFRITDFAHVTLDSDWSDAWGYNLGVMFRPSSTWSIGLSHRGSMDIDYTGTAEFKPIPTGNAQLDAVVKSQLPPNQDINTTIAFPATTTLGIATGLIPKWQIEADATYTTWSRFKSLKVDFGNALTPDLDIQENWHDTWSWRLGANHPVTENWDVRLGVLYDENPEPVEGVGPLLPDADRWGPSFGVGYQGKHFSFELAELYLIFKDRNTFGQNRDNFNGEYKATANLLTLDFGYRF